MMLDLLNGYINYIKIGLLVFIACGLFYAGFHIGNSRYLEYRASVEAIAKTQEAHNEAIQAQHELINQGIKNEYEGKLAAIRNYYSSGVRNPSSGSMSGISAAPKGTDAATAYPILAEQCSETTLQVNLWQEWAEQNGLIK
jgi:hypothetical protein